MQSRAWVIGCAAASVFFASGAYAQCSKDTDCKGDRVCNHGECMEPAPASPVVPAAPPPVAPTAEPAPAATAAPVAQPAPPAPVAPPAPAAAPPPDDGLPYTYHPYSKPLMASGIAVTAAAPATFILGYLLSSSAYDNCTADLPANHIGTAADLQTWESCNDAHHNRLYVLAGVSVVMLGAGIPMIFVGAHRVRDQAEPQALLVPYAGPERAGITLRLKF